MFQVMSFRAKESVFSLLFLLYFLQGLPYGLQMKFLPVLLRSRSFSLSSVGLVRLLSIPWLCKALWAPVFDKSRSIFHWLMVSVGGIGLVFLGLTVIDFHQVQVMVIVLLVLNICTASQDISVDWLAIRLLDTQELGHGNIAQVVGYKVGALFGGGALAWLNTWLPWEHIFLLVSCMYFLIMGIIWCSPVRDLTKQIGNSVKSSAKGSNHRHRDLPILDTFVQVFSVPGTVWLTGYVLLYKLGEQGLASMFPLSLMDIGISLKGVSMLTGVLGQLFSISGSVLGGLFISQRRCDVNQVLILWSILRLAPMALQALLIYLQTDNMVVIATSECLLQLCAGVVTTATFTMMMSCSQKAPPGIQASHYSTLATVEVLGKLLMTSSSGVLVDIIGYTHFSVVCFILAFAVIPVLHVASKYWSIVHKKET